MGYRYRQLYVVLRQVVVEVGAGVIFLSLAVGSGLFLVVRVFDLVFWVRLIRVLRGWVISQRLFLGICFFLIQLGVLYRLPSFVFNSFNILYLPQKNDNILSS